VSVGYEVPGKRLDVELKSRGVKQQRAPVECLLIFEQHVVHRPEPSLGARGLGRFGGLNGVRVYLRQREMPVHEAQRLSHFHSHVFNDRIGGTAVWTFEISVLDERKRRIQRSPNVIEFGHRHRETGGMSVKIHHHGCT